MEDLKPNTNKRSANCSRALRGEAPKKAEDNQLERIADLVAMGELPMPEDLPDRQLEQFATMVRERRRCRLVQFFAQAIAVRLLQERGTE